MDVLWNGPLDLLQALLFLISHAYGGALGPAIVTLSLGVRIVLMPLTYRAAVRSLENRRLIRELRPRFEQIRTLHKDDPAKVAQLTLALQRKEGVSLADRGTVAGALLQASFAGGMLATLRRVLDPGVGGFLWIKDLSQPSLALASMAAATLGIAGLVGSSGGASEHNVVPLLVAPIITLFFVARMSSGFGLHLLASSAVGLVQAVLVRRRHVGISPAT